MSRFIGNPEDRFSRDRAPLCLLFLLSTVIHPRGHSRFLGMCVHHLFV